MAKFLVRFMPKHSMGRTQIVLLALRSVFLEANPSLTKRWQNGWVEWIFPFHCNRFFSVAALQSGRKCGLGFCMANDFECLSDGKATDVWGDVQKPTGGGYTAGFAPITLINFHNRPGMTF